MTNRSRDSGRRVRLLAAPFVALAIALAAPAAASAATSVPGEVIVRFRSGTTASERAHSRANAGVSFKRSLRMPGAQLLDVRGSVRGAVNRLNRQREVLFAQPNFIYHATAAPPNDAHFGDLWGLRNFGQTIQGSPGVAGIDVRALSGWDFTRGGGAVVAVVDTGVDFSHPDLSANAGGGFDFVDGDGNPNDEEHHGTHVAGTVAAVENNGLGVAGVAPDARIMAVRVLDSTGSGSSATIGQGIVYAATHGADVINLSLGGPGATDPFLSNGADVANRENAVVSAAAGNSGQDDDEFPTVPCDLPQPNLICVASVNNRGSLSVFSNYGPTTVDVGAPGEDVLSTVGNPGPHGYLYESGTSMAAPHVAGVAALVRRGDPDASDTQIVQAIKESVHRVPSLGSGFTVTGGMPDAAAAIRRARVLTTPPPPPPTPPAKASFRNSKRTIRVSRSGRFSFSFTAGPGLRGRITLKTVRKVRPRNRGRRRRATFANKTFTVPASGKVRVRFKLSRRNRLILRRYKKLRISVAVKLRNSANLTSTAKVRITLKAPKRRRR
jgi:subtilisin family serine protease